MFSFEELWLPVVGYEGLYEDSNLGRVKSLKRKVKKWDGYRTVPERVLKPIKHADGYLHVDLCKDGKIKRYSIHRLVAQTFLPNPLGLPEVNHKDENKENNAVSNLEWCDRKYNCNYGTAIERTIKANLNHSSKSKPVLQYTVDGELVREWPSVREAERLGGFDNAHISACCSGKSKTHKGFIWKYKEAG